MRGDSQVRFSSARKRAAVAPVAFFTFASCFVFAACSGSTSDSDVSPEQAALDVSSSFCDRVNECAPLFVQIAYGDLATCKARFKLAVQPSFAATGTSATPAQYELCSQDVRTASCEQLLGRNPPESCRVKPGSLTDGAACGNDWQCSGKYCRKAAGSGCGACSSPGAAGAPCDSDEGCQYGLKCTSGQCVALGTAGTACDAKRPCSPFLACVNGTCATPGAAGAPCEPKLGENSCDVLKGLFCGKDKVCTQIRYASPGQACGFVDGTLVGCGGGSTCAPPNSLEGTCQAPAEDGAGCDTAKGPNCRPGARCVGGVCKLDDPASCK